MPQHTLSATQGVVHDSDPYYPDDLPGSVGVHIQNCSAALSGNVPL